MKIEAGRGEACHKKKKSGLLAEPVGERRGLVTLLADITEHREKFRGLRQARHTRDLPRLPGQLRKAIGLLRKKLDRGRAAYVVSRAQRFFGERSAAKIGHAARAENVEMKNLEIIANVGFDLRVHHVDLVHALARRTSLQAPHDREALALRVRPGQILSQIEEALEIPVHLVEAVIAELGLRRCGAGVKPEQTETGQGQRLPPGEMAFWSAQGRYSRRILRLSGLADICEFVYMYHMSARMLVKLSLGTALAVAASLLPSVSQSAELLMFERGGCVWCQRWNHDVGPVYDKSAEAKMLPLRRIDLDRQRPDGLKLSQPIRYTPTFVVIDNGREVGRITGYINDDSFWGLLGTLAAKVEPRPEPDRI